MADDTRGNKPRLRRTVWIVVPAVVVVVVVGVAVSLHVRHWYEHSAPFHVGTCFQVTDDTSIVATGGLREVSGRAKVVDCGTAHDAEITRTAHDASGCAADGAWLESIGQIYCVTLDKT
ncbi:hypothetical protein ACIBTV_30210 [Micromonospora sp. NPDC049366]|uniref:hypothetical protein n=1 Tax=Micromonospora sp. NPDC049366 TaxID=3364271 RepID=UPI0037931623